VTFSLVGQLPRHLYVYVDTAFTHREPQGFIPAVWFGLVAHPGRMWGCTVLLGGDASGACYRNLPPHALAFTADPATPWSPQDAQSWDCYGPGFVTMEYSYLKGLRTKSKTRGKEGTQIGEYLFSITPYGDPWSEFPELAKEFQVLQLANGRLTIQPTNHVVFEFEDLPFGGLPDEFPKGLKRQTEVWNSE
jgi:hypothetical protein